MAGTSGPRRQPPSEFVAGHRCSRLGAVRGRCSPGECDERHLRDATSSVVSRLHELPNSEATDDEAVPDDIAPFEEFDEHLAALREQHRRRPSLIEILDKAGLTLRPGRTCWDAMVIRVGMTQS